MTSHVEKVRREYDAKLKAAEATDTLLSVIPFPDRVTIHMHTLWDKAGSMRYGDTYGPPTFSWADAVEIARALPSVPLCMVRDSCLSFQTQAYVDSLDEASRKRRAEESPVAPVLVDLDGFSSYTRILLRWVAQTPVGLVDVKVVLPPSPALVVVRPNSYTADAGHGERRRYYERPFVTLGENAHSIQAGGIAVAQTEAPIYWAAGTPESQGNVTIYFVALNAEPDAAALGLQIVEHLARLAATPRGEGGSP